MTAVREVIYCSSLDHQLDQQLSALARLVGNTPLLGIRYSFRGRPGVLYAKCEQLNLTGSIKDRMALHILKQAYAAGELQPGDTIAEATSGNTGISLAAIGRALGHPVTIFMPDWMSDERIALIRSFGAEIVLVSKEEGGFLGSIRRAEELAVRAQRCFSAAAVLQRRQRRGALGRDRARRSGSN